MAEFFQFLTDGFVKLREGEELFITKGCGDPRGYVSNRAFRIRLVLVISNYR